MTDRKSKFKKLNSKSEKSSSSSDSTSSFSSDDDTDDENLKPIKDYLMNRREAARQLFKSVKTEKIRMMLPQDLKKMDLDELEEWCASELCGMSKTRILSILNGTPMVNSSDTSDTDDSGPSLEIISDTEEWLSDDSQQVKKEPLSPSSTSKKGKAKRKIKINKNTNDKVKLRKTKTHENQQQQQQQQDDVKIKKEKEQVDNKNQEGESLLDLLELEMRARAIRALIRKEEDIIPTSNNEQKLPSNVSALKTALNSVESTKNKTNIIQQQQQETVEEIVEKIGDDEDVVLVIKPPPTIEVISSDSEPEQVQKTVNKKSNNITTPEKRVVRLDKTGDGSDALKIVVTQNILTEESLDNSESREKLKVKNKNDKENNDNKTVENCDKESSVFNNNPKESTETTKPLIKKVKKKHNLRVKKRSISEASDKPLCDTDESIEEGEITSDLPESSIKDNIIEPPVIKEEKKSPIRNNNINIDDDEIVDLDDYPDDMYNIEPDEIETVEDEKIEDQVNIENNKLNQENSTELSETWATRYYQTDNVQNVIKESKIQSEIRKRLRERQRLSKLNNSPKSVQATSEEITVPIKPKPTGSVEEYFALKSADTGNISSVTSESSEIIKDKIDELSSPVIASKELINPVTTSPSILPPDDLCEPPMTNAVTNTSPS